MQWFLHRLGSLQRRIVHTGQSAMQIEEYAAASRRSSAARTANTVANLLLRTQSWLCNFVCTRTKASQEKWNATGVQITCSVSSRAPPSSVEYTIALSRTHIRAQNSELLRQEVFHAIVGLLILRVSARPSQENVCVTPSNQKYLLDKSNAARNDTH